MSLNLQDPLLRLTGIHPRQTGGPLFCQILTDFARGGRRANSTPGPARGTPRITIRSRTPVPPVTCTVTSPGAESNPPPISITRPKIREPLPTLPSPRTRAAKLLKMGGMPQWQPARRAWDKEKEVELTEGTLTIRWPPRKWKDLDPQQKLLQWEFAAMQILKVRGDEYQSITQTDLLDQSNFLALPGTVSHKPPRRSASYMANKGRLYTYE